MVNLDRSSSRRAFVVSLALLATLMSGASSRASTRPVVYVVPVEGVIDLGLAPFVERVLDTATRDGAAAVVLEINTFGGRVDAAVVIRDALLRARVRTIAFVNKRAISAGALIALASEKIAMADGGTIGAATPVEMGSPGGPAKPVAEKTVSYMRKEFRATAESRKRPPLVAEAMVDPDVEIRGVIAKGKLLTLTTDEALKLKVADFRADTLEAVLKAFNIGDADVRRSAPTWAETVVRFLTNPIVSSLLMTVGMLGIIVELRTPGFGLPGALGITSLALFFWGHWLIRLAGWEELLLVGLGLSLLAAEIFVIPGFGVPGVLGLVLILAGLGLSIVGAGATWDTVGWAVGRVAISALRGHRRVLWSCFGCFRACRWADTSCWPLSCRPPRATRRRPKVIGAGSAGAARPPHRYARRVSPPSTASAWTWCRRGSSSRSAAPSW